MPPKKNKVMGKKKETRTSSFDGNLKPIDVQYNPDIIDGLLQELKQQMEAKCNQLQKDSDFMTTSIQQAFHLELIKLPTQVKNMSLTRFKEEFGDSLEAVTRGAIGGSKSNIMKNDSNNRNDNKSVFGSATKNSRSSTRVFQTPSGARGPLQVSTVMRNPKEGEKILSENGSPLGDFKTLIKAPKTGAGIVPPTPGVFIPLDSGDVIDMDSADIDNLSRDHKEDALIKMRAMMDNIQLCMAKLEKSTN